MIEFILHEQPEIIALQEVCQSASAGAVSADRCRGFVPFDSAAVPLKADNHALRIAEALNAAHRPSSWTYLPFKLGYERYDEGLALLSLCAPIAQTDAVSLSADPDYRSWRTRMALGIRLQGCSEWFYSVHMGWWEDEAEPFAAQWERLNRHLYPKCSEGRIWLMGDFNAPASVRSQSYDLIASSLWHDSYLLAQTKQGEITVPGAIDGWEAAASDLRIDQIWCSEPAPICSYRTVFTGLCEPVVSDHFGILIQTGGTS